MEDVDNNTICFLHMVSVLQCEYTSLSPVNAHHSFLDDHKYNKLLVLNGRFPLCRPILQRLLYIHVCICAN